MSIIHGTNRDADEYYEAMQETITLIDEQNSTLIVAPHFKAEGDDNETYELQWGSSGWKQGNKSLEKSCISDRLGSFEVLNQLIDTITSNNNFPNLEKIIITGHSAGGQFTQRYAGKKEINSSVPLKFIIANPGTYMYLDSYRTDGGSGFSILDLSSCADYDKYKYGLSDLSETSYMSDKGAATIKANYLSSDIIYLLGESDTRVDDLDQECEAMLQGANRYERGTIFKQYLDTRFSEQNHNLVTVPNVGHSKSGMYQSPEGRELFR